MKCFNFKEKRRMNQHGNMSKFELRTNKGTLTSLVCISYSCLNKKHEFEAPEWDRLKLFELFFQQQQSIIPTITIILNSADSIWVQNWNLVDYIPAAVIARNEFPHCTERPLSSSSKAEDNFTHRSVINFDFCGIWESWLRRIIQWQLNSS